MKDEIADYEDIREKEAREDDPAFCRSVSMFFPEHYPLEKMRKVFLGLQALLESEYELVPELAMEYVMYSLIQARIGDADDLGIKTLDPIPDQKGYVISILCKEYPDKPEVSDDGEDLFISWRENWRSWKTCIIMKMSIWGILISCIWIFSLRRNFWQVRF